MFSLAILSAGRPPHADLGFFAVRRSATSSAFRLDGQPPRQGVSTGFPRARQVIKALGSLIRKTHSE